MKLLDLGVYDVQRNESGQSIVLIALLIIGLIAFAGIATDVGMLFARSSQFTAAVDAAALAGVVDLPEGFNAAIDRSTEFLIANWPDMVSAEITGTVSTTGQGYPEFVLTVTLPVPTYFLRVLGFDEVPVTRSAAAALYSQMDMPTATQAELGMLRTAGQFVNGPDSCTAQGDPISARWSTAGMVNPLRDLQGARYTYRIQIPDVFVDDLIEDGEDLDIQLFDPDSLNSRPGETVEIVLSGESAPLEPDPTCPSLGAGDTCMFYIKEHSPRNPAWLHRLDETWLPSSGCPTQNNVNPNGNTITEYTLYYFNSDDQREDLARFTTGAETDLQTDMAWVTPGIDVTANVVGSFRIASTDFGDPIPLDGNDYYSLYLDVEALTGTSKNGWDVWAGSSDLAESLPSDGNERNQEILSLLNLGSIEPSGIEVFAQGYLPVMPYSFVVPLDDPLLEPLPLAAVSREQGGGTLYATVFGFNWQQPSEAPFQFNFSRLAPNDRPDSLKSLDSYLLPCATTNECNDNWVEPDIVIPIPSGDPGDHGIGIGTPCPASVCTPFYGGYLTVAYTLASDEHVWSVTLHGGRPFLTR